MTISWSLPVAKLAGRVSILLIAFVVPLAFSIHLEDGFELIQSVVLLWLLTFSFLVSGFFCREVRWNKLPLVYGSFVVFWGLGLLSFFSLRENFLFYAPSQNYLWVLGAGLLFCPAVREVPKRKIYFFMVLSGVLGSFYSFAQALDLDLPGWSTNFAGRSFSTLGNPTFWAGYLLVALPLALHLAWTADARWKRVAFQGSSILLVLSLLTTQTRAAWMGFGVEVIVLSFFIGRKKKAFKFCAILLLAFGSALMIPKTFRERTLSIFSPESQDAQGRYFLWKAAKMEWESAKWMGLGPGGYAAFFPKAQTQLAREAPFHPYWKPFHAHNEYFEFFGDRGLVGCFFGLIFVSGLWGRRWKEAGEEGPVLGGSAAEASIIAGLAVHSFFHFPLSIVPIASSLALLMNPFWKNPEKGEEDLKKQGGPQWLALGLGIFFLTACPLSLGCLLRDAKLHQSIDALNQGRAQAALDLLNFPEEQKLLHYWDPRVSLQKAYALKELGRLGEAAQILDREIFAYPEDADAYATLCMVLGQQKLWGEAQAAGEKALQIAPSHPGALNNLAMLFYLQGRRKEAVGYLERLEEAQKAWGEAGPALETFQKIQSLSLK